MKPYTDITILLDRSGSMAMIKDAMEGAFYEFIQGHKVNPTTKVTLIQFDNENDHSVTYQCVPVGSVERLNLTPRGSTPLIDAFVKAIDRTGERLAAMRESERPDQVLMVVITDGQENSSRNYKRADVNTRVTNQHNKYGWNFVYLGANQDAIHEAATYGIPMQFAMNYTASEAGARIGTRSLTSNTVAYASSTGEERSRTKSLNFTDKQRKDSIIETTDKTSS